QIVVQAADQFCSRLPARDRRIVLARLGANDEPSTLEQIGRPHGLTRERVRQIVLVRLAQLCRRNGPPFAQLLGHIAEQCTAGLCPLTPELLEKWLGEKSVSRHYSYGFYVRIIQALAPECPV